MMGTFVPVTVMGAPFLNQKADRIQRELQVELPRGADTTAIQAAFSRRGWVPTFDPVLNNYVFLIKENSSKDGILVRVWLDKQKCADRIEVKAVYSPDFG
jgi:hypothetical protein